MYGISNSTSAFYRRSLQQMNELRADAERLQAQVSSGERLAQSSDDPVAASRLRALARADRLAGVDAAHAAQASEELGQGAEAIQDIANAVIRARELALWAATETLSDAERAGIAEELDQLRNSIFASANVRSNTGRAIFGGETPDAAYVMDGAGTVTYAGTAQGGTLDIGSGMEVARGITGPNVLDLVAGGSATDIFAFIQTLAGDLRGGAADPGAAARDAIDGFDSALATLTRAQTVLGARIAWIDTVQQGQIARGEARSREGGEIGGVELASAITRMQQVLTVLEASQASFARLSSLSLFDAI